MADVISVGKNIKNARKEKGLTQREVSIRTEISITQLSSYENGKQMPGLPTLANLATALGTSLDQLYFGAPSEAFLNMSEDYGETIVNCFTKLRQLKAVDKVSHAITTGEGSAHMPNFSYELQRLFSELNNYDLHKNFYTDGDSYVAQIKKSVANEINERHFKTTKS